jgi:hypothetical protein
MSGRHRMGYEPPAEGQQDGSASDDSSEPALTETVDTEGMDIPDGG